MKNQVLYLMCLVLIGFMNHSYATHIKGGEINIEVTNCTSLTIKATLVVYSFSEAPSNIQMGGGLFKFGDGMYLEIPEGAFTVTSISENITQNVYVLEHSYTSLGSFVISYSEQNRNEGILNIENSVNTPFYVESNIVIDPFLGCINSTSSFLNTPFFEAVKGSKIAYSFASTNAKDDKIRYSLVTPKKDENNYVTGYFFPENVSIDTLSGLFYWNTMVDNVTEGEYSFAVKVSHFRLIDGQYYNMGYVIRDVQFNLIENNNGTLTINDNLNSNQLLIEHGDEKEIILSLNGENYVETIWEVHSELQIENLVFESVFNTNDELELKLSIISNQNIIRENPYIVSVRAHAISNSGMLLNMDRNYLIYTQNVIEPVLLVTGLSDKSLILDNSVYPNPVKDYLFFSNNLIDSKVTIYSLIGEVVKTDIVSNNNSIQVGSINEGTFFIVTDRGNSYRVVIQQ